MIEFWNFFSTHKSAKNSLNVTFNQFLIAILQINRRRNNRITKKPFTTLLTNARITSIFIGVKNLIRFITKDYSFGAENTIKKKNGVPYVITARLKQYTWVAKRQ